MYVHVHVEIFLYLELFTEIKNEMEIISYDNYTCTETISLTIKMCTCLLSLSYTRDQTGPGKAKPLYSTLQRKRKGEREKERGLKQM